MCVKKQNSLGKGTFNFINPDYGVKEWRHGGLLNFLTERPHRTPRGPKGAFLPPPRPLGMLGCPVYAPLSHPFFVPSPQAGATRQLAITMAIAGAKLWLEGVLSSRDSASSVGEMAGQIPLSCKTETSWKEPSWDFRGRRELLIAGNRVRLIPQQKDVFSLGVSAICCIQQ